MKSGGGGIGGYSAWASGQQGRSEEEKEQSVLYSSLCTSRSSSTLLTSRCGPIDEGEWEDEGERGRRSGECRGV